MPPPALCSDSITRCATLGLMARSPQRSPCGRKPLSLVALRIVELGRNRVADPYIVIPLGWSRPCCRQIEPCVGNHRTARDTVALVVHEPELILRRRVPRFGGAAIPVHGNDEILRNAASVLIHEAEQRLCFRVAALRERDEQPRRGLIIAAAEGVGAVGKRAGGAGRS